MRTGNYWDEDYFSVLDDDREPPPTAEEENQWACEDLLTERPAGE